MSYCNVVVGAVLSKTDFVTSLILVIRFQHPSCSDGDP